MTDFLNQKILFSVQTLIISIGVILTISASFWVGYGQIMATLVRIETNQIAYQMDAKYNRSIDSLKQVSKWQAQGQVDAGQNDKLRRLGAYR